MTAMRWQGGVFSVLALLTSIACVVLPPADPQSVLVWVGLLIVLLGVPHGALDPIYAQAWPGIQGRAAWAVFVWAYLLLAACVLGVWWWAPTVFLWGFLAISVLHFSGDLATGTSGWTRFFYGGAVIVLPAALHAHKALRAPDQPRERGLGGARLASHGLAVAGGLGGSGGAECAPRCERRAGSVGSQRVGFGCAALDRVHRVLLRHAQPTAHAAHTGVCGHGAASFGRRGNIAHAGCFLDGCRRLVRLARFKRRCANRSIYFCSPGSTHGAAHALGRTGALDGLALIDLHARMKTGSLAQMATHCWMFFSFISLPGPLAITSPRSITRYRSARASAKS
jgi:hypothetical protein